METTTGSLPTGAVLAALLVVIVVGLIVGFGPSRLWSARQPPINAQLFTIAYLREKYDDLISQVARRKILNDNWAHSMEKSAELQALFSMVDSELAEIVKDGVAIDEKIRELEAMPDGGVGRHHLIAIVEALFQNSERLTAVSDEFEAGMANMEPDES